MTVVLDSGLRNAPKMDKSHSETARDDLHVWKAHYPLPFAVLEPR
jgi:hypothetical protein